MIVMLMSLFVLNAARAHGLSRRTAECRSNQCVPRGIFDMVDGQDYVHGESRGHYQSAIHRDSEGDHVGYLRRSDHAEELGIRSLSSHISRYVQGLPAVCQRLRSARMPTTVVALVLGEVPDRPPSR